MKRTIWMMAVLLTGMTAWCQQQVRIVNKADGNQLTVDGTPLFLNGMNWDYFPIGTNWAYSLWEQPEVVIRTALDNEMLLMKMMGVNVVRQYATIPPRWVQLIYEKYGIYTVINHSFGRYGVTVGYKDYSRTDYADAEVRTMLLKEVEDFANTYRNTPGVLMYLLGNENNYGLFWKGAETEDIPVTEQETAAQVRSMYELMNEAARRVKVIDPTRPVAICNGDLQFLDIIAEECKDVDILGINCYRGHSFDTLFKEAKRKYGKPVLLTEFGADALNAVTGQEAQLEQADILLSNWREIYQNAAGMGQSGNCIGGFTFQFSDGWWKCGQKTGLDVHDTHASWANGGYRFDYVKGKNNMNEEWFGICAKGMPDSCGLYHLQPRRAYEVLKEVHRMNPYRATPQDVEQHFSTVRSLITKTRK